MEDGRVEDMERIVRKAVSDAIERWREAKSAERDLDILVEYDDSYPYFSGRPWRGIVSCDEIPGTFEFEVMPLEASKDVSYLERALDSALSDMLADLAVWRTLGERDCDGHDEFPAGVSVLETIMKERGW